MIESISNLSHCILLRLPPCMVLLFLLHLTACSTTQEVKKQQAASTPSKTSNTDSDKQSDQKAIKRAQIYFSQGKRSEGVKILNKITPSSPVYARSRIILGIEAVNNRNNKMAVKPLEQYFSYMKNHIPDPENKKAVDEFLKAVGYLRYAYTKLSKPEGAVRAIAYAKWLNKNQENINKNMPLDKYETILVEAQAKLDVAENMISEKKTGWEPIVNSVLKPLESIYLSESTTWTAMAAIERARAFCLLKRYQDGLQELTKHMSLIKSLDAEYKKHHMFYTAPSAKAYLWQGNLLLGLADKTEDKEKRAKFYFRSGQSFLEILSKYNTKSCPYTQKAIIGFKKVKNALDPVPKVHPECKSDIDRQSADSMFAKRKYTEALPIYLSLLKSSDKLASDKTPDILYRITICYLKTGETNNAVKYATSMARDFPNDKQFTPVTLLMLGEHFWKEYKRPGAKPDIRKKALDNALKIYNLYIKTCPSHQYVANISARIAKVYYDNASKMAKGNPLHISTAENLEFERNKVREAYLNVIPYYQKIVENYPNTEIGRSSSYILPWCYTNGGEYEKGAELFLKFAEIETNAKTEKRNMEQVADAKLRAAENYAQAARILEKEAKNLHIKAKKSKNKKQVILKQAAEKRKKAQKLFLKAVVNIKELLNEWMQSGGRLSNIQTERSKKKIKKVKKQALALLEQIKTKIPTLNE